MTVPARGDGPPHPPNPPPTPQAPRHTAAVKDLYPERLTRGGT